MKNFVHIIILFFVTLSFLSKAQVNINSSGYVGINNASPSYRLDVSGTVRFVDSSKSLIYSNGSLYNTSGLNGFLGTSSYYWGYLYVTQPFFTNSPVIMSDKNLKTDIKDFNSVTDMIKQLRPVKYKLNYSQSNGDVIVTEEQFGLIAQEVQKLFPEIVADRGDGTLGIKYTELIPVLIKTCQEQQTLIDDLKARVAKLESFKN